jgi:hypothetical protein
MKKKEGRRKEGKKKGRKKKRRRKVLSHCISLPPPALCLRQACSESK